MKFYILFFINILFLNTNIAQNDLTFPVKTIEDKTLDLAKTLPQKKASVFVFLMPDCPLCEYYAGSLKKMQNEYAAKNIDFYLVFAGTLFPKNEIEAYLKKYDLHFTVILDNEKKLARVLGAEVTPQAIVIGNKFKIIYNGKIDNWITANRQHRTLVTEYYLLDALQAVLTNKTIKTPFTEAVGCFIQ